jgi:uncharacterized membrane protein (DUF485 family)
MDIDRIINDALRKGATEIVAPVAEKASQQRRTILDRVDASIATTGAVGVKLSEQHRTMREENDKNFSEVKALFDPTIWAWAISIVLGIVAYFVTVSVNNKATLAAAAAGSASATHYMPFAVAALVFALAAFILWNVGRKFNERSKQK